MARPDPELKRATTSAPAGLTLGLALALALATHAGLGLLLTTTQGVKTPPSKASTMRSASMTLRMAAPSQLRPAPVNEQLTRWEKVAAPGRTETEPRFEPAHSAKPANPTISAASVHLVEQLVVPHPDAPLPSGQLRLRALVGLNSVGQWVINTDSQTGRDAVAFVRSLREGLEALSLGQALASAQPQLCLELLFEEQQAVKVKLMTEPERCLSEARD
jgi:hypothetical protein